jgi:hypothetical protein
MMGSGMTRRREAPLSTGICLLLLAVAAVAGCFTLSFKDGSIRCSTDPSGGDGGGRCPAGFACIEDHCFSTADDIGLFGDLDATDGGANPDG